MNIKILAYLGVMLALMLFVNGQAHAMNLLVAVGNPHIQLMTEKDGTLTLIRIAGEDELKVGQKAVKI